MKTTVMVMMSDQHSGRSIKFRVPRSRWETPNECSKYGWMSDGQRKKAEDYFGKMAAYYTSIEIV